MKRLSTWIPAALLCLAAALPLTAQTTGDRAIAMLFYPPALDADFRSNHVPGTPVTRIASPLRVDLDKTGNYSFLAVGYSNGMSGALRIIRGATTADAVLVAEAGDRTMGGRGRPFMEAVDIDNDGIPEIAIEFSHATWIYKYVNGSLVLYGPSIAGKSGPTSNLGDVGFADLDGDGVLEILEMAPSTAGPYVEHKLGSEGKFARVAVAPIYSERFVRGTDASAPAMRSFPATPGPYVLQIVNGDQLKTSIVTSAEIRINGVTVASAADFKKSPRKLTIPVTLLASNDLSVELRSDAGTMLTISVVHQ